MCKTDLRKQLEHILTVLDKLPDDVDISHVTAGDHFTPNLHLYEGFDETVESLGLTATPQEARVDTFHWVRADLEGIQLLKMVHHEEAEPG